MSTERHVQITRCKACGTTFKRYQLRISFRYTAFGWQRWGLVCRKCAAPVLKAASGIARPEP